jgi:hypothetical protein
MTFNSADSRAASWRSGQVTRITWMPNEGGLDRTEIEEPPHLRLVHRVAEPALAHHLGQVHECASHTGRGE